MKKILGFITALSMVFVFNSAPQAKELIKIATTSPGVPWSILGAKVAAELNKRIPDVSVSSGAGGSTANISDVSNGTTKLGWTVNSTALEAWEGQGQFEGRAVKNFEMVGPFAATPLQVIVRKDSGIEKVEDLESKRFAVGQASWGTTELTLKVLDKLGITPDSVKSNGGLVVFTGYDAWQAQMQDGIIDAVVYWGGIPSALTIGLINEPGVEFVSFTDDQVKTVLNDEELKQYLFPMTIKSGTYDPIETDLSSFTYASVAIANPDLSEDVVYETLKILYEGEGDTKVYKDDLSQTLELAELWLPGNSIPLHPGATKYFKEKGIIE